MSGEFDPESAASTAASDSRLFALNFEPSSDVVCKDLETRFPSRVMVILNPSFPERCISVPD